MVYSLGWGTASMEIGAEVLSWIPIVGHVVGNLVGSMTGSKFGKTVCSGLKCVGTGNKKACKSVEKG